MLVTVPFSALSTFGDILPSGLRWSACLGALGILLYRETVPAAPSAGLQPADRARFVRTPVAPLLESAVEVWLFAPSGKNFLSSEHCAALARVLRCPDAVVRCVVLDPRRTEAVGIASAQMGCDRGLEPLPKALAAGLERLRVIAGWGLPGDFSCRLFGYNPGFSLIAIDPRRGGPILVELHGVRNETSSGRMSLLFTRGEHPHWHNYWTAQFLDIWDQSHDRPLS